MHTTSAVHLTLHRNYLLDLSCNASPAIPSEPRFRVHQSCMRRVRAFGIRRGGGGGVEGEWERTPISFASKKNAETVWNFRGSFLSNGRLAYGSGLGASA